MQAAVSLRRFSRFDTCPPTPSPEHCDRAIAGYVQLQANCASSHMHAYGNAIAAVPGAMRTGGSGPIAGVLQPSRANPLEGEAPAPPAGSGGGGGGGGGSLADFLGGAPAGDSDETEPTPAMSGEAPMAQEGKANPFD